MKQTRYLLIVFLLFASSVLNAQVKKNQVKLSLLFAVTESLQLSYERLLNDEMSLNLEGTVGTVNSVRASFRYYLTEVPAPTGGFIAPNLQLLEESFGGGIQVGYQRLFKETISLEAFLGPQVYLEEGVGIWGGVNLGFAF